MKNENIIKSEITEMLNNKLSVTYIEAVLFAKWSSIFSITKITSFILDVEKEIQNIINNLTN